MQGVSATKLLIMTKRAINIVLTAASLVVVVAIVNFAIVDL